MGRLGRFTAAILLAALLCGCSFMNREAAIPGDMFLAKETEHGLFYVKETEEEVGEMVDILSGAFEQHYRRITDMLQFAPPDKTVIFIYPDLRDFQRMIGRRTEGTYDAEERRIKVYTPARMSRDEVRKAYADQLVHEFVHAVILQMNPLVGHLKWLDEGTAYYVSGQLQDELQSGRKARKPIPQPDEFADSDSYFARTGGEAYYFSGLMVKYIAETFGEGKFNAILRDPEAMESILGMPMGELYDRWKEYVTVLHEREPKTGFATRHISAPN